MNWSLKNSMKMPLSNALESLHEDGFEGSNDEHKIFEDVLFTNESSGPSKSYNVTRSINFEQGYSKHLGSKDEYYVNSKRIKLSTDDISHHRPDTEKVLKSMPSLKESFTDRSCPSSDSKDQAVRCFLVESSSRGVASSCYLLNRHIDLGRGGVCKSIASPSSQEICATDLLVARPPITIADKSGSSLCANRRLYSSDILDANFLNKSVNDEVLNDPQPLLYNHIFCLLEASGWHIEKRKTNTWQTMKPVLRSPDGKQFNEVPKAWQSCGQSLLSEKIDLVNVNTGKRWSDIAEFWLDLSTELMNIEKIIGRPENTSALAHRWIFLDPFVTVVFIEKKFGGLRKGNPVETRGSLLIDKNEDDGTVSGLKIVQCCDSPMATESALTVFEGNYLNHGEQLIDCPLTEEKKEKVKRPRIKSDASQRKVVRLRKVEPEDLNVQEKLSSNQMKDGDLLISATMKNKYATPSNKSITSKLKNGKSKRRRKLKSQKRSRNLLARSVSKSGTSSLNGNSFPFGLRTVLSWLIDAGVVALNDVIQYRNSKDDTVVKDGFVTRDGIVCRCCNDVLSVSMFKIHAGFKLNRPCLNLFMESGMPYTLCQLQAWSAEYKTRKGGKPTLQIEVEDQNDDTCGLCGDGGELVCCDNCPATYHQACLSSQEIPDSSWYCSNCTCRICGDLVNENENSASVIPLKCLQCEHKYHGACLKEKGVNVRMVSDSWFCGRGCQEVYSGLHSRVGLMNIISEKISWTLLKCIHDDQKVPAAQWLALKAECNSKLTIALSIMEECFSAMVDPRTGIDMIPHLLYNWGSSFVRLNFEGFYTLILEKDDVLVSAACLRIHGVSVAEMPLIATCSKFRRQGMCRCLMNALEEMLKSFKVEKLVISAIPHLVDTWTRGFGFELLEGAEKEALKNINLMVFPGTVMLRKTLYQKQPTDQQAGTMKPESAKSTHSCEVTTPTKPDFQSEQNQTMEGVAEMETKVSDLDNGLKKQFLSASVSKLDSSQIEMIPRIQSTQNFVYDERKLLLTEHSEKASMLHV